MIELSQNFALILGNLLVAVIVAVVTVRLSIRQFHSTRWWEKKAEAYTNLMESAASLMRFYWVREGELLARVDLKDSEAQRRSQEAQEARRNVEVAAAAGDYLISKEAHEALLRLRVALAESFRDFTYDDLCHEMSTLEECLETLRRCAKEDLKPDRSILLSLKLSLENFMEQQDRLDREHRRDG